MFPINTDDGGVHVYAHPEDNLDEHAEESEEEVMIHIDLAVQSFVIRSLHCVPHSSLVLCIMFSTLQEPHRGFAFLFFFF